MPSQDLSVFARGLGVPLRLGKAVEADPSVRVLDAQDVAERVGFGPRAFPQVGQFSRTCVDFAPPERAVVVAVLTARTILKRLGVVGGVLQPAVPCRA